MNDSIEIERFSAECLGVPGLGPFLPKERTHMV
jgi:hypothetical protein